MRRFRIIILIVCLTFTFVRIIAQDIQVKSFSLQMEPMTVPMQRVDANGNVCALVKVIIPNAQASFEGSLIGKCDYKTSEYWCYLSPGSKQLKIKYPNCEPLMVNFESFIGSGLKSKQIYELTLLVPNKANGDSYNIHGEININPLCPTIFSLTNTTILSKREYPRGIRIYHNLKEGKFKAVLDSKDLGLIKDDGSLIGLQSTNVDGSVGDVMMRSPIPFTFSNVRIGDTFTVMCDEEDYSPATIEITGERIGKGEYNIDFNQRRSNLSGYLVDKSTQQPIKNVRIKGVSSSGGNVFNTETDENGYFKVLSAFNDDSFEIYFIDDDTSYIPIIFLKGSICNRQLSVTPGMRIDRYDSEWSVRTDDGNSPEFHNFGRFFNKERWISYPQGDSMKGMTFTRKGYPTIHINGIFPGSVGINTYPKGKSNMIYEYNMDGTISSHKRQN